MEENLDPAFRALADQAKRVCAKHPDLLPAYLAAIRDRAKGMKEEVVEALLAEVSAAAS